MLIQYAAHSAQLPVSLKKVTFPLKTTIKTRLSIRYPQLLLYTYSRVLQATIQEHAYTFHKFKTTVF
jgi:hypothetical protein